ncbi:MAG TPA: hypothetical protein DD733_08955 [Clostridiales bacterium]|nr:hypothetical protein [Eubacteriales bacterium]HBR32194.1 hypothetical protein [Clostridiales bacterium]
MATIMTESIITVPNEANEIIFCFPTSATKSETFTFGLSDTADGFFVLADASGAMPGNYTISFAKGVYPPARTPKSFTFSDGTVIAFPVESGHIEDKNSKASFTVVSEDSGDLSNSGIKLALIKKRYVTNN